MKWIPVAQPPANFTRVVAKNEDDAISEAYWMEKPEPGFYVPVSGGARRWPHVTHYIPWPQIES